MFRLSSHQFSIKDIRIWHRYEIWCIRSDHFLTLCFTQHLKYYNTTIRSHKTLIAFTFVLKHWFTSFILKTFYFFKLLDDCYPFVDKSNFFKYPRSRATCCDYFWRRWCKSEEECQYFIIWQILWKGPQLLCWWCKVMFLIIDNEE